MKIYTKGGDAGATGLLGGTRVSKADLRIETYGTIDELNTVLGMVLCDTKDQDARETLLRVQSELFTLGSELAISPEKKKTITIALLAEEAVTHLEQKIDAWDEILEPLKNFILPGGTRASAQLHYARAVCRRAERYLVRLNENEPLRPLVLSYVNRLSDFLFVFARYLNHQTETPEAIWCAPQK
ncbi:MAG: cob(I)yrinic acid a,c-diamide adenosyltransferase [Myxococcales bacterium]|nr:MAG: cob(I)yrinic acid a,c-diamide adenosyltransferase [Myxococcales bacterium]